MIQLKNILAENMYRFGTKNLNEQDSDANNNGYPDKTEEIGDQHIEFFDELANKLGWYDFNHMERNSDDIPEYAKILFNMVCELSGKYPPFN